MTDAALLTALVIACFIAGRTKTDANDVYQSIIDEREYDEHKDIRYQNEDHR